MDVEREERRVSEGELDVDVECTSWDLDVSLHTINLELSLI